MMGNPVSGTFDSSIHPSTHHFLFLGPDYDQTALFSPTYLSFIATIVLTPALVWLSFSMPFTLRFTVYRRGMQYLQEITAHN
jgi:hypothetical protein